MSWVFPTACIVGCLLPFLISYRRRHRPIAPRRQSKFLFIVPLMAVQCFVVAMMPVLLLGHPLGATNWVLLGCGCLFLVAWWRSVDRPPTDEEAQVNYYVEPHRCGQCGYDLTGNTSGLCPECGWTIPREPSLPVDPTWGMFWRKWEIAWMDRPGRRLLICLGATAMAITMGLVPLIVMKRPALPVMVGCAVFFLLAGFGLINSWRIWCFIRRASADRPGSGLPPSNSLT